MQSRFLGVLEGLGHLWRYRSTFSSPLCAMRCPLRVLGLLWRVIDGAMELWGIPGRSIGAPRRDVVAICEVSLFWKVMFAFS